MVYDDKGMIVPVNVELFAVVVVTTPSAPGYFSFVRRQINLLLSVSFISSILLGSIIIMLLLLLLWSVRKPPATAAIVLEEDVSPAGGAAVVVPIAADNEARSLSI